MSTNMGVYKIINSKNKKVYVGSSINLKSRKYKHFDDLNKGKHPNKHLQNSYNLYGRDNFIFEIIEYIYYNENKELLRSNLLEREQYWIEELEACDKGYNIRKEADSNLGLKWKLSKESVLKIVASLTGRIKSQETRDKIGRSNSIALKGKRLSEEHRNNLSKSGKGKKHKPLSEEHKKILREKRKNTKVSEQTRKKMRESREKKKVINMTTNLIFNSIKEASSFYGVDEGSICKACKGILKSAGKFTWAYFEEAGDEN